MRQPHARMRVSAPSDRWTSWARALTERHTRISSRHGALSLVFGLAPARIYLRSQRWERVAWGLAPQIHLAIAPLLRMTTSSTSTHLALTQARNTVQTVQLATERIPSQPTASALASAKERDLPAETHPPAIESGRGAGRVWQVPLDRVLNRLRRRETLTHLDQTLLTNEGVQVSRRVVEALQRVEEKPQRTLVIRRSQESSVADEAKDAFDASFNMPRGTRVSARHDGEFASSRGWMDSDSNSQAALSPPTINVEQLADQVMHQLDHRLIAYRERLGKGV